MSKKARKKMSIFIIILFVALIIYSAMMIGLMVWGFNTSLKHRMDFHSPHFNVLGLPDLKWLSEQGKNGIQWGLFDNYKTIIENLELKNLREDYYTIFSDTPVSHTANPKFGELFYNTIIYVIFGAFVTTIVPCVCGYMCAKYRYKISDFIHSMCLVIMIIPIVGAQASELKVLKDLGLFDTLWGNVIQKLNFTGLYFFVFYAFFEGVPDAYQEAAEVDGASQLRVLVTIMLPLAIKMIGTVFLLKAVFYWNDYQTILLYLPTRPTFAYAVYDLANSNNYGQQTGMQWTPVRLAGSLFLIFPILILFIFAKDKLMGNVSMGGLKG